MIFVALFAASLPFVTERIFGLISINTERRKSAGLRLLASAGVISLKSKSRKSTWRYLFEYVGLTLLKTSTKKSAWMRLVELIVLYFVVGALGFFLESNAGNRFEQKWEFFAVTACLFMVLAFPGFVFRYLLKSQKN
nr:DUF2818 family protein [uncultured Undibacterium sp.]